MLKRLDQIAPARSAKSALRVPSGGSKVEGLPPDSSSFGAPYDFPIDMHEIYLSVKFHGANFIMLEMAGDIGLFKRGQFDVISEIRHRGP